MRRFNIASPAGECPTWPHESEADSFRRRGTLFHLPKSVGYHYALVGRRIGLQLEAAALDRAFARVWKEMPPRLTTGEPREDDDKGWWRELVDRVFDRSRRKRRNSIATIFSRSPTNISPKPACGNSIPKWSKFSSELQPRFRLGVISNFDGRLAHDSRAARHLEIFFRRHHLQRSRRGQTGPANFSPRARTRRRFA